MRAVFAAALVFTSTLAAHAATIAISAPREVTQTTFAASRYDEWAPRIASDGTSFAAVWQAETNVRLARLSANGAVIRPEITIENATWPSIAFGGGRYLVTWAAFSEWRGAFLTEDGLSSSFRIALRGNAPAMIAFDGSSFFVSWRGSLSSSYFGAFVSAAGTASKQIRVPTLNVKRGQKLVTAGGKFYLAVAAGGKVSLVPITEDGPGTPIVLARRSEISELHTGNAGGELIVSWQTKQGTIQWLRVDGADVSQVHSFDPGEGGTLQRVISAGEEAMFVYGDATSVYVRPAHPDAQPAVLPLPSGVTHIDDATGNDTALALVFTDGQRRRDVYAMIVDAASAEQPAPVPLDVRPVEQFGGEIAAGNPFSLATWVEYRANQRLAVVAARIDPSGGTLDPTGFDVLTGSANSPRVAWNGRTWLVSATDWDRASIVAARVTESGQVVDTTPIRISGTSGVPWHHAVASDGAGWIVAFFNQTSSDAMTLYSARVSADGIVSGVLEHGEAVNAVAVEVAASPEAALIVWQDVDGAHASLRTAADAIVPLTIDAQGHRPAVVWNGSRFLVAYSTPKPELRWFFVSRIGSINAPAGPFFPLAVEPRISASRFANTTLLVWNSGSWHYVASVGDDGTVDVPPTRFNPNRETTTVGAGSLLLQQAGYFPFDRAASKVVVRTLTRKP
jgi:hypothetical protein